MLKRIKSASPKILTVTGAVAVAAIAAGAVSPGTASAATLVLGGIPDSAVTVTQDPDGTGELYTLTADVETLETITMPNGATLDGAGHTLTAIEDAAHPNFPGAVLASAVGDDTAPATLDVRHLHIATQGFENGSNSGGKLTGISMLRAGGSLTDVSVVGISHGNGVQEGNAVAIRNRVSGDNIDVPRAKVTVTGLDVANFQKTGLLLDGNLAFSVTNAHVGQGSGPQGQPNPTIAANSLQISRGASGSVSHSSFALNSHEQATAALLYNARNVDFDGVAITGGAAATTGIDVSNASNTINTVFTMRGGEITRSATATAGTAGLRVDEPAAAITATTIDTPITGWDAATTGTVIRTTSPVTTSPVTPPAVRHVNVTGRATASRPHARSLKISMRANKLGAHQVEAKVLRWKIVVDGHVAATVRQHAGDTDSWRQRFVKKTGRHTVTIVKNGVALHTYQVSTR